MAGLTSREQRSHRIKPLQVSYTILGKEYRITRCTTEDIPVHKERVSQFWTDSDMQLNAMHESVASGGAYKLVSPTDDTVCFLYGIPDGKFMCGMSFWCKTKAFLCAGYMFIRDYARIHRIYWSPYRIEGIVPLGFMLDNNMITDYWNNAEYVTMKIPCRKLELLTRWKIHRGIISGVKNGR